MLCLAIAAGSFALNFTSKIYNKKYVIIKNLLCLFHCIVWIIHYIWYYLYTFLTLFYVLITMFTRLKKVTILLMFDIHSLVLSKLLDDLKWKAVLF